MLCCHAGWLACICWPRQPLSHPHVPPPLRCAAGFRGSNQAQLCRSAHGADVHPLLPNSIVIMGGYGGISSTYVWMNDVLVLHTDTWVLRRIATVCKLPLSC